MTKPTVTPSVGRYLRARKKLKLKQRHQRRMKSINNKHEKIKRRTIKNAQKNANKTNRKLTPQHRKKISLGLRRRAGNLAKGVARKTGGIIGQELQGIKNGIMK